MINCVWLGRLKKTTVAHRGGTIFIIPTALAISLVVLVFLQTIYWPYVVDDVYISLTYARNLGDGLGLVHNQGLRVEGFSNLLWVLLMAPFRTLGLELLTVAKVSGILLSIGTLVLIPILISKIVSEPDKRVMVTVISLMLLAISPAFALWGVSGLETPLFTILIIIGLLWLIDDLQREKQLPLSPFAVAALALTRPEGFVFFLAAILWLILFRYFGQQPSRPTLGWVVRWSLMAVTPIVAITLFRYFYYGQLLPNTVYTKAGGDLIRQSLRGMQYFYHFSSFAGYVILILSLVLGIRYMWRRWQLGIIMFFATVYLVFIIASGGDWMPYFRFFVPILPLLVIIFGTVIVDIVMLDIECSSSRAKSMVLMLVVTLLIMLPAMTIFDGFVVTGLPKEFGTMNKTPEWVEYIRDNSEEFDKVAVVDVGRIGYVTDLRIIDMYGLIDNHIAHVKPVFPASPLNPAFGYGYGKWDVDYILEEKPEFIQVQLDLQEFKQNGVYSSWWLGADALVKNSQFQDQYQLVELENGSIFVRRDRGN